MAVKWQTVKNNRYYFSAKTGAALTGSHKIGKKTYYFTKEGKLVKDSYSADGTYVDAKGHPLSRSTLKKFLQTAMKPVGSTLYVWGGGWNKEDTGSGTEAVTIGVSSRWKEFYGQQDASYSYKNTRYQIHNGLDCSGFVGWTVYNAFNTTSGNAGYVMLAQNMTRAFSDKGWGRFSPAGSYTDYRAGDICSSPSHVYIVVGQCNDGSVVLVHSSPQGVRLCGTPTRGGNTSSQALHLAADYMRRFFPGWYNRYPTCSVSYSYLTNYSRMRWYLSGDNHIMTDPDHYADKDAAQILRDLFGA